MTTDGPVEFVGSKRFSIQRQLGAGGMGIVYLATDRESGQAVALKTLKAVDPTAIFQFKQEFRSLSELVHPNLIRMHELICENDQWFFVMELVEGAVEFQDYLLDQTALPEPTTDASAAAETATRMQEFSGSPASAELPVAMASASARAAGSNSPFHVDHSGMSSDRDVGVPFKECSPSIDKTVAMGFGDTTVLLSSGTADAATIIREVRNDETEQIVSSAAVAGVAAQHPLGTVPDEALNQTVIRPLADSAIEQTMIGSSELVAGGEEPPVRGAAAPSPTPEIVGARSRGPMAVRNLARLRDAFRQLSAGVRGLHRAGMLHRDLKPANALVSGSGTVVLLDFGLVAELSAKRVEGTERREISGTIAYMSPEQAQALPLTEASDWYAVGVMLFHALTGTLPFTGKAIQILRRKTVEEAPAPTDLVDGVPPDLNELCVKLLRRQPDQRPSGREVAAFFGVEEADDEAVPQAQAMLFVGRERHLAELDGAFQEVLAGQTNVIRVHGRSGAGKSALIQHFLDGLTERQQAIVLTGRCYEQESVPYKGVDSLFDAVTQFLRNTTLPLTSLLPTHITALARIFPVLNRIKMIETLGQSQMVTSDLHELRSQAFEAFRELLSHLGRERPLVIYLDDLQWGDIDSAALLADLFGGEQPPRMLLLAAYRSEYVDSSVCLKALIESEKTSANRSLDDPANANRSGGVASADESVLGSSVMTKVAASTGESVGAASSRSAASPTSGTRWKELVVESLTADETRLLARSLLRDDLPNVEASADRIVKQSGGSAYFVYELARHLNAGLDLASIAGVGLDEVLWARVQRLSEEAQRLMQVLAVSGQPIPLKNVLEAAGLQTLSPRVLAKLRTERFVRSNGPGMQAEIEAFHDRIRESVVGHLSADVRRGHHGQLADTLERSEGAAPETIAGHLEGAERFEQAGRYYSEAARFALQKLAFDRAEEFSKHAVRLAQSDDDTSQAHERLIHFYTDMARFPEAYAQGREAAKHFGVSLPAGFVPPLFIIDFLKAKWRLLGKKTADLVNLPVMQDARLEQAVRLINAAAKAAYQVRPELCVAVSTKVVNLCLKHGNTPDCAIGWMVFGAIFQGGVLGNHPVGHEYGRLALNIIDKFQQERQRPEVTFVVGYFGTSWMRPATEAEALWRTTYESGRATGDLFHTGCACAATTQSLLMRGVTLGEIWTASDRFLEFLKPVNLREPIGAIRSVRQLIRNLCGKTRGRSSFSTDSFDEEEYVAGLASYGSRHFAHFYFVNKMLSQYLWREYDAALTTSLISAKYLKESPGMLHSAEHFFLTGLIQAALADRETGGKRRRFVGGVRSAAKRLAGWAARCPHNFEHKARLLSAELARLKGASGDAESAYDAAIRAATQFGYRQVEAIAHQLASQFHSSNGSKDQAQLHRSLAEKCFADWGASAHLKHTI